MGYISSGEAIGSRRTPLIFAGKLGDLVDTPNVRNVRRVMSTRTIKYGYAFSDAARNAAVQKLLRKVFNEIRSTYPTHLSDEIDDGDSASDSSCCNP